MVLEADIRDIVKDIRQCLRYSLFMDIPKIEGTNSRDYNIVEAVFEEVIKKCRGMGFEDNFFGVPKKGTDEHKTRDIFDECRVTMKKICFTDCIESTYYLLRRIVGAENPWTSYAWAQYLDASEYLNPGKTSGLDYLLNNLSGDKKIKADGIKYTFPPSVVGDSGKSTQLTSKINTIKKKLEAVGLDKVIDLGNDDARVLRVPIDRIDVIHMLGLKGQRMLDTDETKHNLDYWRTYRDTIKSLHSVRGSLKGNTDAIQPYTPRLCTVKYLKTAVDMLDKKATNMLIESIISA